VVSVKESHGIGSWRGRDQRDEQKRTIDEVSKLKSAKKRETKKTGRTDGIGQDCANGCQDLL
jgi:hypothetical protein